LYLLTVSIRPTGEDCMNIHWATPSLRSDCH
jgi:hypothetical protein